MKYAIVLAGGIGKRMKSSINKVMHKVVDKPLIGHLVEHLEQLDVNHIEVVVGYQQKQIKEYLQDRVFYTSQQEQLGTGHALQQVTSLKGKTGKTLILVGDVPLVTQETMKRLYDESEKVDCVVLTAQFDDPKGYGRIIRDNQGYVKAIIEDKESDPQQQIIKEINTGIYCFDNEKLFEYLPQLSNENSVKEYFLTDLIEIFTKNNLTVKAIRVNDNQEVMGINNRVQLSKANYWLQQKINEHWMLEGVTIIDPNSTYISMDTTLEQDITIYPNVHIKGKSSIGSGSVIYPNSWIENSQIGQNTTIDSSKIMDSIVKDNVSVGPFSHLRMNSLVEDDNRIGNFVELKKTHLKQDSRVAHLTYLGDSEIGSNVNIGCGVVTVNYDGLNKFKTIVKDGAFVGSNVNLIAPITVGKKAVVAAGSTISQDVHDGDLVIERSEPIIKEGKGFKYINKKKEEE